MKEHNGKYIYRVCSGRLIVSSDPFVLKRVRRIVSCQIRRRDTRNANRYPYNDFNIFIELVLRFFSRYEEAIFSLFVAVFAAFLFLTDAMSAFLLTCSRLIKGYHKNKQCCQVDTMKILLPISRLVSWKTCQPWT